MNPSAKPVAVTVVPVATPVIPAALPYVAAVFQGAAPPPSAPVLELLPWEQKAQKEAEKQQQELIRKQKHDQAVAEQKKKGGLFSQLSAVASTVAFQAEKAIDSGIKETSKLVNKEVDSRTVARFHAQFPALVAEKLQWHANGKLVSGGAPVDGELFISQHFLAFHGIFLDSKTLPGQTLRRTVDMAISISGIISIQHAIANFGKDLTAAPAVVPLGPGQVATALMVFSMDRTLHLFYQFTGLNDVVNVLDHMWRALVNTHAINLNPPQPMMQQPLMMQQPPVMQMGAPMPGFAPPSASQYPGNVHGQPFGQPIQQVGQPYGQAVGQQLPPAYGAGAMPAPSAPPSDDLYPMI